MLWINALPQRLDTGATPTFTGILAGDGTAAAPSISFSADTDTGFYRSGSGNIRFSSNGVDAVQFSNTGTTFIPGGINAGYIANVGAGGGLALVALGTNQNITLTPSGTGVISAEKRVVMASGQGGNAGSPAFSFADAAAYGFYYVGGTAIGISAGGVQTLACFGSGVTFLGPTPVDSGNGRLQLATHTTSAGGIGFGTDTALFRASAGEVVIAPSSGAGVALLSLQSAGGRKGYFYWDNSSSVQIVAEAAASSLVLKSSNLTALTLDSSQNATFAGTVKPILATTAGAPAYVKGAIYFDTTLNKLRVGGASAWETITSV